MVHRTLSSCIWRYLVFLDWWRGRTVAITQMVLGKVAIRDNLTYVLPVPRSLLQQCYGRATAEASIVGFPQGKAFYQFQAVHVGFLLLWSRWIQPTSSHPVLFRRYHSIMLPSLPRSVAWSFPSRFLVSFCMRCTSAMLVLVRHSHPFQFVRPNNAEWAKSYVAAFMKYCENMESPSTVRSHDMVKIHCCFSPLLSGYIVLSSFWYLLV